MTPNAFRTFEPRPHLDAATRSRQAAECCTSGTGPAVDPSIFERLGRDGSTMREPDRNCWDCGVDKPPLPVLIESVDELLARFEPEVELDDPAMLERHATAVRVDENGVEVPVNTYQDIDGELFVDGVDITDIDQQAIGDCYFMAALGSLALTNPDAIENMITDNGNGTYTVHFGGDIGDVTVDDDFPVDANGRALYAGTGDGATPELWVAVIEKAYAQAEGSYGDIVGGWGNEAIAELTGHDDFTIDDPSAFTPEQLGTALDEGRTVTATSHGGDKGDKIRDALGIVGNHVYVVADVRQVDGEWQVQVYNPWGSGEVGDDGVNDGLFWIGWDQFEAGFRQVEMMNTPLPEAA